MRKLTLLRKDRGGQMKSDEIAAGRMDRQGKADGRGEQEGT